MKIYNKLVRDKIEQIMINNGAKPITRILTDEEYIIELNKKLQEEVEEYLESGSTEELADIEEVIRALLNCKKVSYNEFEEIRQNKVLKRGSFNNKLFLEKEE